ncbi:diuretic hormone 45 isoform X3 [Atheta coriaria]
MMRVPVYIVCAAIIVAVNSEDNYYGRQNAQSLGYNNLEDQEALGYMLPRLMAKYRLYRQWGGAPLPSYYPISDIDSNNIDTQMELSQEERTKRAGRGGLSLRDVGPSLSISNSLDVLRNRLLLEMSRKKELEGANRNRGFLCKIGKRGALFDGKRRCEDEKYVDDN